MATADRLAAGAGCLPSSVNLIERMPRIKTLWIKDEYLQQILAGRKTVEVRVAYSNIARLKPGDTLLLNDQHRYTIIDVRCYSDFNALVEAEDPATIAPDLPDREALLAACRVIYPPEKEVLGVVALEIAHQVENGWSDYGC
jgi:ASC-1-like (ASCH) protein